MKKKLKLSNGLFNDAQLVYIFFVLSFYGVNKVDRKKIITMALNYILKRSVKKHKKYAL